MKKESIKPINDYVFIRREKYKLQSDAGIILQSISVKKPTTGVVVAAGPGTVNDQGILKETDVKKGDRVVFEECFTNAIENINGEELVVVREKMVIAVIENTQDEV